MDFILTEEQRLLVETIREFVRRELKPLEEGVETSGYLADEVASEIQEKSRGLGLYAINIPREFGGGGLSVLEWMMAEEQFGRTSDILIRRAFGNVYEILLEASEKQKQTYLLPAVRGERTFSIAFTEPEAGSDAAAIKTKAERSGKGWILASQSSYSVFRCCFSPVASTTSPCRRSTRGLTNCLFVAHALNPATGPLSRIVKFDKDLHHILVEHLLDFEVVHIDLLLRHNREGN